MAALGAGVMSRQADRSDIIDEELCHSRSDEHVGLMSRYVEPSKHKRL